MEFKFCAERFQGNTRNDFEEAKPRRSEKEGKSKEGEARAGAGSKQKKAKEGKERRRKRDHIWGEIFGTQIFKMCS